MPYSIISLDKGKVDETVLSKVDQTYRRKALEYDNLFITKANTSKTRPDVVELQDIKGATDYIVFNDNELYLQKFEESITEYTSAKNVDNDDFPSDINEIIKKQRTRVGTVSESFNIKTTCIKLFNKTNSSNSKYIVVSEIDFLDISRANTVLITIFDNDTNKTEISEYNSFEDYRAIATNNETRLSNFNDDNSVVLSPDIYLPEEFIYDESNNKLYLNMLGELYEYDLVSLFIPKGSQTEVSPQTIFRFPEIHDTLENPPIIAQIYPNIQTPYYNIPYTMATDLNSFLNIGTHPIRSRHQSGTNAFRASIATSERNIIKILTAISNNKNDLKFSLMDLKSTCLNSNVTRGREGNPQPMDVLRYIMPDIKMTREGEDIPEIKILQPRDSGKDVVFSCDYLAIPNASLTSRNADPSVNPQEINADTRFIVDTTTTYNAEGLDADGNPKDISRRSFPDGAGYSVGNDGVCFVLQETPDIYGKRVANALNGVKLASGRNFNSSSGKTLAVIKLNIDWSHPRVIEYMNNLEIISLYRSSGKDRFKNDVLVNISKIDAKKIGATAKEELDKDLSPVFGAIGGLTGNARNQPVAGILVPSIPTSAARHIMVSNEPSTLGIDPKSTAAENGISGNSSLLSWITKPSGDVGDIGVANHEFSTLFQAYRFYKKNDKFKVIGNRLFIGGENTVSSSEFGDTLNRNLSYKRYINQNQFISKDPAYLTRSKVPLDFTENNNDPQSVLFPNERVTNIDLLSVRTGERGLLTSDKRILAVLNTGVNQVPSLVELDDIGADEGAIAKFTSSVLFGLDGNINQTQYSEQVNAFATNLVNDELTLNPITSMVQLISKHRIILASHKIINDDGSSSATNILSCIALGTSAQVKGITPFIVPDDIKKIVKVSEDKVILLGDVKTYEMDFTKFTGNDKIINDEGMVEDSPIVWVLEPTPIRYNTEYDLSISKPRSIDSVYIGLAGDPVLKVEIIDRAIRFPASLEQKILALTAAGIEVRETDINEAAITENLISVIAVENFAPNSGRLPTVRLSGNGSVVEITSIDVKIRQ
ncbi:MAG: hypothetical protein OXF77_02625 [Thaumarchaeota archaeon]|nr:hypothetical protein [Nitrososphaerota archaeon]